MFSITFVPKTKQKTFLCEFRTYISNIEIVLCTENLLRCSSCSETVTKPSLDDSKTMFGILLGLDEQISISFFAAAGIFGKSFSITTTTKSWASPSLVLLVGWFGPQCPFLSGTVTCNIFL